MESYDIKQVDASGDKAHEPVLATALPHIREKGYATELGAWDIESVLGIAVAFRGKHLWLAYGTEPEKA